MANAYNLYELFDAAFKGDLLRVQKMLADGVEHITDTDQRGRTALSRGSARSRQ
jgi:hypothetical protein